MKKINLIHSIIVSFWQVIDLKSICEIAWVPVQSATTAQNCELGLFYFIIISQLLETRALELIIDAMFFLLRGFM